MWTACLSLVCCAAAAGGSAVWPKDLAHFAPLVEDRERFVTEIRTFDQAQQVLANAAQQQAEELLEKGEKAQAEERMQQARQHIGLVRQAYELALQHARDDARLHNYYGELLYDRYGEQVRALREWNTAMSLDSKLSAPYNNLGLHYFHVGVYDMGLENLDHALKLDPKNPDYLYNLAQVYLVHFPQIGKLRGWKDRKKVYREAMKLSKKAAKLAPGEFPLLQDYAVNFFAAENFGVDANWKDAAKAWQAARAHARNEAETFYTWLNEGRAWIRAGRNEEAKTCIEEALKIFPGSEVAQNLLRKTQTEGS